MSVRQSPILEIRRQLGAGKPGTGSGTAMGGTVLIGDPPYALDGPALTGQLPIARVSGLVRTITAGFDGGGSALVLPAFVDVAISSARTLTGWSLLADQVGAVTVEVLRGTLADMEAGTPPSASLTGGSDPELAGVMAAADSALAGWTTSLAAGDVVRFVLSAVDGVQTKATLTLTTT